MPIGNTLLVVGAAAALWCGLWALLSKTFTRLGHFGWHLRVFVVAALAVAVIVVAPAMAAFAFSWPWLTDFSFIAVYAACAAAIYFHLLAVEPARQRRLRVVVGVGLATAIGVAIWFNLQRTGRPGDELYMAHLFPPGLRLATPVPADRFVDGLTSLQPALDAQAREKSGADRDAPEEDDDEQ